MDPAIEKAKVDFTKNLTGALDTFEKNVESTSGWLSGIFGSVGRWFTGIIPGIARLFATIIPGLVTDGVNSLSDSANNLSLSMLEGILDAFVGESMISGPLAAKMKKIFRTMPSTGGLLGLAMIFGIIPGVIKGGLAPMMQEPIYRINDLLRSIPPGLGEVLRATFIDPATITKVRDIGHKQGLSDENIDLILKGSYAALDAGSIRSRYYRAGKDEATAYKRMRELGFTDTRIKEHMETWPVIPGVGDLITMMVKEAFNDSAAQKFGLDAEYPGVVAEWSEKQGLSADWVKRYWRAHWQHISPSQAFEMLHRGILTEEDVADLLKVLDYPTYWRSKLTQLSYNPITRVDVRRVYSAGVIGIEEVEKRYLALGYSPTDAKTLTTWTQQEYAVKEKELTQAEVIKAYSAGQILRGEAAGMLMKLGCSVEKVTYELDMADNTRQAKVIAETLQTIELGYLNTVYDEVQARTRMTSIGLQPMYIDALIEQWQLKRELKSDAEQKELESRSLADLKQLQVDSLQSRYNQGELTESQAANQLVYLGYSSSIAYLMIEQWPLAKAATPKEPTRSDLDRFLREKLISSADYITRMIALGYTRATATLYLNTVLKGMEVK